MPQPSTTTVTHCLRRGKAISATYINELVVNLATYEQSYARFPTRLASRQVLWGSVTRMRVRARVCTCVPSVRFYYVYARIEERTRVHEGGARTRTRVQLSPSGARVTSAHDLAVHQSPLL